MSKISAKILDMVNGEVTKIEAEGYKYTKVEGNGLDAIQGDIVLVVSQGGAIDYSVGEFFIVGDEGIFYTCSAAGLYRDVARQPERYEVFRSSEIQNEIREIQKWVKIGRGFSEIKEGDIVRYKKCWAEVTRIGIYDISIEVPNGIIPVAFNAVTLIAPVESRFDKDSE